MSLTDEERAACAEYTKAAAEAWGSGQTDVEAWRTLADAIGGEDQAFIKWLAWCDEQFGAEGGGR